MNERIKQLIKQAGLDDDMFPIDEWDNPELEKFAELIVEEACQALKPMLRDMISRGQGVVLIRQHFGVAE
jgi:short-subunit dehydrogenase